MRALFAQEFFACRPSKAYHCLLSVFFCACMLLLAHFFRFSRPRQRATFPSSGHRNMFRMDLPKALQMRMSTCTLTQGALLAAAAAVAAAPATVAAAAASMKKLARAQRPLNGSRSPLRLRNSPMDSTKRWKMALSWCALGGFKTMKYSCENDVMVKSVSRWVESWLFACWP